MTENTPIITLGEVTGDEPVPHLFGVCDECNGGKMDAFGDECESCWFDGESHGYKKFAWEEGHEGVIVCIQIQRQLHYWCARHNLNAPDLHYVELDTLPDVLRRAYDYMAPDMSAIEAVINAHKARMELMFTDEELEFDDLSF